MKLYDLALSGHAHRARLTASLLGLDVQLIPVDLLAGVHKQADYLAINPFGQVPALEDGVDPTRYSNVVRWLRRFEALPGFVAMPATDTSAKAALAA